jgi:hypothetical protein
MKPSRTVRSIYEIARRTLGAQPNALSCEQLGKLSPEAQMQLLRIMSALEDRAEHPSGSQLMKLIAQGRLPGA